jgi:phytoene dehydrogenase-like protein
LMITAQNQMGEVNALFGAASLCYTNYGNYYLKGGLIELVQPFLKYIQTKNGKVLLKEEVMSVVKDANHYTVKTNKNTFTSEFIISGIPLNNMDKLYENGLKKSIKSKLMLEKQVNSAFQMGIVFKKTKKFETLHHQIHLTQPLLYTESHSIFISLNHESDTLRTNNENVVVASVSTHFPCEKSNKPYDKDLIAKKIIDTLVENKFFVETDIVYYHIATPQTWENWTNRAWGLLGGYPQFMKIKPWQMPDARLDGYKAYQVGDTVYPGQGIPGVTLSGIIAFEKLKSDWL